MHPGLSIDSSAVVIPPLPVRTPLFPDLCSSAPSPSSPSPPHLFSLLIFLFYLKATKVKLWKDISIYLLAFGKHRRLDLDAAVTVNGLYLLNGSVSQRIHHLWGVGVGGRWRQIEQQVRGIIPPQTGSGCGLSVPLQTCHPDDPWKQRGVSTRPRGAATSGGIFAPLIVGNEAAGCRGGALP